MSAVDPNQVIDDSANVAHAAVAAPKPFWKSRTFWFNVLAVGAHYFNLLPASVAPYVLYAVGAANIALRAVTTQPITL